MSKSQDWKQKYEELSALLREKDQALQKYQKTIKQSNALMREVMDKLSMELKTAHQIHRILLPVELPVIPDCEFSFKFCPADSSAGLVGPAGGGTAGGKDFYEVLPHQSRRSFGIIMSTCSSHALSALLFSARLKMMSRGEKVERLKPDEFAVRLMEEIKTDRTGMSAGQGGSSPPDPLQSPVSLFYAVINQRTYQMFCCLAGDITVLVRYAETGEVETVKPCVDSLRAQTAGDLTTCNLSLSGRDRLLVCSPGVLRCQNPAGDMYSLSSLKTLFQNKNFSSVHEVRNQVFYELESFAQGTPATEDQSVLVMEIKSRILKLTKGG